jgi:hypothetical protein
MAITPQLKDKILQYCQPHLSPCSNRACKNYFCTPIESTITKIDKILTGLKRTNKIEEDDTLTGIVVMFAFSEKDEDDCYAPSDIHKLRYTFCSNECFQLVIRNKLRLKEDVIQYSHNNKYSPLIEHNQLEVWYRKFTWPQRDEKVKVSIDRDILPITLLTF